MAIFIRLEKSKFKDEKRSGKFYARTVKTGEVNIRQLAARIQNNTTFKQSEVKALIDELVEEMKQSLQQGETVCLDGFGRFHLSVESNPVAQPEDFNVGRDVTAVKCRFLPASRRNDDRTLTQVFAKDVKIQRWKE